jgi:hypothetical protein
MIGLNKEVIWIIPQNTEVPYELAKEYNDSYKRFVPSKDKIHPRSYLEFKGI